MFCVIRSIQRKYTTGRPDQKDLNENLAATQGLSHMITECQHLFQVRDLRFFTFSILTATFEVVVVVGVESD